MIDVYAFNGRTFFVCWSMSHINNIGTYTLFILWLMLPTDKHNVYPYNFSLIIYPGIPFQDYPLLLTRTERLIIIIQPCVVLTMQSSTQILPVLKTSKKSQSIQSLFRRFLLPLEITYQLLQRRRFQVDVIKSQSA